MTIINELRGQSIFAENEDYIIRNLTDNDRNDYIRVLKSVSSIPKIFETDGFEDITWDEAINSNSFISFALVRKLDYRMVGDCMIKHSDTNIIEVGLDIGKVYQNQGIGTAVLRLFTAEIRRRYPEKKIVVRIYSDNDASQHIIKSLDVVKIGEEPSEYDAAMAIMREIYQDTGLPMPEKVYSLSENHIDVIEIMK